MVAGVTAAFALLSARQVWVRAVPTIPYSGMNAMSSSWAEEPADDDTEWLVSEGQVPPPSKDATRANLVHWLRKYYPVLALDLPPDILLGNGPFLDLGGGPPRRLFVEPGRGLVGRAP